MILVSWFINLFRSKERIRRGREKKRVRIITVRKEFTFHPRLASSDRKIGSSTGQSPGHVSMHSVKKESEKLKLGLRVSLSKTLP
jgi:hypothetical protein